jgi:hypothetical protein
MPVVSVVPIGVDVQTTDNLTCLPRRLELRRAGPVRAPECFVRYIKPRRNLEADIQWHYKLINVEFTL